MGFGAGPAPDPLGRAWFPRGTVEAQRRPCTRSLFRTRLKLQNVKASTKSQLADMNMMAPPLIAIPLPLPPESL